jgi:hypothetical protein
MHECVKILGLSVRTCPKVLARAIVVNHRERRCVLTCAPAGPPPNDSRGRDQGEGIDVRFHRIDPARAWAEDGPVSTPALTWCSAARGGRILLWA